MGYFSSSRQACFTFLFLGMLGLASCAKNGEKTFQPVVAKIGSEVRAISRDEALTLCKTTYCEENQIYVSHFGRRRHNAPAPLPAPAPPPRPAPQPTVPGIYPNQPAEQMDYSRSLLNMGEAWALSEGSESVIVAVIDSGVDYFHPDLIGNIAVNTEELRGSAGVDNDGNGYVGDVYGWDFYNDRPNGYDDNGHGTHCAGVIAAGRNGIGVRGIAPRVKILPVKFLGANGDGDTVDAIHAIDYAVARGAKILSNSWGGGGASPLLDDAIQRAVNRGVLFVAAAGNSAQDIDASPSYPASYANVIAVGSSDSRDERSPFSNYGSRSVEVFAPGSSILSTFPNGQYRLMSGTSMAAPQVSGALALAVSIRPEVSRAALVEDLCLSSVNSLSSFSKCGRMNVAEFVRRVSTR